jgi:hypothetical protein
MYNAIGIPLRLSFYFDAALNLLFFSWIISPTLCWSTSSQFLIRNLPRSEVHSQLAAGSITIEFSIIIGCSIPPAHLQNPP